MSKIAHLKNYVNSDRRSDSREETSHTATDSINTEKNSSTSNNSNTSSLIHGDNKENFKKDVDKLFKPYTQNIILQIQVKTDTMPGNEVQTKSTPLHIEVYTSKWCEKNSRKVRRRFLFSLFKKPSNFSTWFKKKSQFVTNHVLFKYIEKTFRRSRLVLY